MARIDRDILDNMEHEIGRLAEESEWVLGDVNYILEHGQLMFESVEEFRGVLASAADVVNNFSSYEYDENDDEETINDAVDELVGDLEDLVGDMERYIDQVAGTTYNFDGRVETAVERMEDSVSHYENMIDMISSG